MSDDTRLPAGGPELPPPLPPPPPPPPDWTRKVADVSPVKADLSGGTFGLWMIGIGAVMLAMAVHRYAATNGLPYALGNAMAPFLMGALIAGICRLCGARRLRFCMAVAASVIVAINVLGSVGSATDAAYRRQDLHDAAVQLRDIADGTPSHATGGDGPMSRLVPKMQALVVAERQREAQHEATQDALQIETVLTPATLVDKERIADGRDRLARALADTRASMREYAEFVQSLRALLDELPPAERAGAYAGFDKKMPALESAMDHFLGAEENLHIAANGLLNLAEANLGKITIQKGTGKLVMPSELAADYNARIQQIQALAKDEERAVAELRNLQSMGRQSIDDLEKQLR
jgi:hypothetical protein